MPDFAKKFIVDAVETGLALVFALQVAFPASVEEAQKLGITVFGALVAAVVSAARRAAPGLVLYLKEKLGVE